MSGIDFHSLAHATRHALDLALPEILSAVSTQLNDRDDEGSSTPTEAIVIEEMIEMISGPCPDIGLLFVMVKGAIANGSTELRRIEAVLDGQLRVAFAQALRLFDVEQAKPIDLIFELGQHPKGRGKA